ncbi:hypothetical protein DDE82_002607 [Stemphylium lycopersici]|nr:hypothetical protein DDE82_002607 [Stemphylium lycopersici]
MADPNNPSPFAGAPLWDPSDEEWADMDASRIASTFTCSFKEPTQYRCNNSSPPGNRSTLSRFTNTITSFLQSSTLAASSSLRQEEEERDKLAMLQNTYYTTPSGDLCDDVMRTVFLTGSRFFDRDGDAASPRSMHVLDLSAYFTTPSPVLRAANPRLSDAIATLLSHTSAACVTAFLDPRVREFVFTREVERRKGGNVFVVRREGSSIIAGSYRNQGFSLQWSLYVGCGFNGLGLWYEDYATPVLGSTPIVDGVVQWDTFVPFTDEGVDRQSGDGKWHNRQTATASARKIALASPKMNGGVGDWDANELSPWSPKFALYKSRLLAHYLLRDIWVRLEGRYECWATWEADGQVNEVRLRRAMIGFRHDEDDD